MPLVVRAAPVIVALLAVLAAVLPRPAPAVERVYASGLYPALQAAITGASNHVPVAVFDVALVALVAALVGLRGRVRRVWRRDGTGAALAAGARGLALLAASGYLWFLLVWGLNYSRPPIDMRLRLPPGPPSEADVRALVDDAVAAANLAHGAARAPRAQPYHAEADLARLWPALDAAMGRPRPTVPGRVKPTLLAPYFRMAGVDGLTAPLALETLLNPDLVDVERPFTLAHEWAHLAGHAPEADANYVAWRATMSPGADPATRYSGWLFLLSEAARHLPAAARREALAALADGPRQDLAAIARRQARRVAIVERLGWRVYDSYLRSQGVEEGIRSYSRVVELIVRARRLPPPAVPQ